MAKRDTEKAARIKKNKNQPKYKSSKTFLIFWLLP